MNIIEKSMVIYLLTNMINGKRYVGQTTRTLKKRLDQHMSDDLFVDRAIKNHGLDKFVIEVLDECETIEELKSREMFWIATLNCKYPNGYNFTDGGEGSAGCQWTLEARERLTLVRQQYYAEHPEAGERRSAALINFYAEHPEIREQLSVIRKRNYESHPEIGIKISESLTKFYTEHPEKCEQISASLIKHYAEHPETRLKMAEAHHKAVMCLDTGVIYSSIKFAAVCFALHPVSICSACHGRQRTAGGHKWALLEQLK